MAENDSPPIGALMGRLLGRGREELEKAARRGRDQLHLRQLKTDRDRLYQKLGKEVRNLLDSKDISHPGLARTVERIEELEQRIRSAEDALRVGDPTPDTPDSATKEEK